MIYNHGYNWINLYGKNGGVKISIDYGITKICRESEHGHIKSVKMFNADTGSKSNAIEYSKDEIVRLINNGSTIYTYPTDSWLDGAKVRVYHYEGVNYLRSVADDVSRDNLGSLPNYC